MKHRWYLLFMFFVIASLPISGCALSHEALFKITDPHNGNVFPLNQPVTIRVRVFRDSRSSFGGTLWESYEWVLSDAGVVIAQGSSSIAQGTFEFVINSSFDGAHYISARARAARPDPDFADLPNNPYRIYSDWLSSNEVCIYIGSNAPEDFCTIRTIVQPLMVGSITPTPTATATPVTPVPIRRNPNQHGGSGCSQYHSQSSCNLAGCSWNPQNSSCTVTP
jgi:hypothetical protein